MYTFNPKKFNTSWDEITRFNPVHKYNATRQPGWGNNETVTFNRDCEPFHFFQLFVDIGKILAARHRNDKIQRIN